MNDLVERLEEAEKGDKSLNREIFLLWGGELRPEVVNKQSGDTRTHPFWPGQKDPCMGISFSTNVQDLINELTERKTPWLVSSAGEAYYAEVGDEWGDAKTPALALCAALVRYLSEGTRETISVSGQLETA